MVRKIRIAFLVAIAGYLLAYLGITYFVNSTVSVDPSSNCSGGDLSCVSANIARTLALDATLYSFIAAGALAVLAWMIVPAGSSAASGKGIASSSVKQQNQNESSKVVKGVAQPSVKKTGVKCSRCGAENGTGNKFCVECGQSMVPPPPAKVQCSRCGAENGTANKFCVECGQSMVPPPPAKLKCTHCGADNGAANKFCVECGQSMVPPAKKLCTHCGAHNEPGYSFCTDCGTPLTVPYKEPELQGDVTSNSVSEHPLAS